MRFCFVQNPLLGWGPQVSKLRFPKKIIVRNWFTMLVGGKKKIRRLGKSLPFSSAQGARAAVSWNTGAPSWYRQASALFSATANWSTVQPLLRHLLQGWLATRRNWGGGGRGHGTRKAHVKYRHKKTAKKYKTQK